MANESSVPPDAARHRRPNVPTMEAKAARISRYSVMDWPSRARLSLPLLHADRRRPCA